MGVQLIGMANKTWCLRRFIKQFNEATFSKISMDSLYLRVAQMPRSRDQAVFIPTATTTGTDKLTALPFAPYGVKKYWLVHCAWLYIIQSGSLLWISTDSFPSTRGTSDTISTYLQHFLGPVSSLCLQSCYDLLHWPPTETSAIINKLVKRKFRAKFLPLTIDKLNWSSVLTSHTFILNFGVTKCVCYLDDPYQACLTSLCRVQ